MKLLAKPIREWFGFTRRERRSTFTLLILIAIVIIIRYSYPDSKTKVESMNIESAALTEAAYSDSSMSQHKRMRLTATSQRHGSQDDGFNNRGRAGQEARKITHVELNTCDTTALIRLPGIGSVLASRIIKYRKYLGGFANKEQLKEVYGLSEETYALVEDHVTADSSFISKININTADFKELSKVRYLDKYEITSILKYKELSGKIGSMTDLTENKILKAEKIVMVRPYLKFD
jgi:DNA uptake protein ComE-like DNA-binding protein